MSEFGWVGAQVLLSSLSADREALIFPHSDKASIQYSKLGQHQSLTEYKATVPLNTNKASAQHSDYR